MDVVVGGIRKIGELPQLLSGFHPGETIGILVADRFFNENAFYSNLYRAVLKCAAEQDISVLMEIVLPQAEKSCNMPNFLVNHKVDGLIFMGEISRRYLATAVQTGVPFMLLDFYDDAIAADCVLSDNTSGSYTLTEHLISTGRRNIGFVGSVQSTSSIMNYMNPLRGIASMHCSANTNMEGTSSAIFFGLSGTGKTTLSTDPKRKLIGDDEHGWDDEGVFNYEGGCYAKVINLDKESEPDIYAAIKRDALLENVTVDANGKIDFADKSVTENTRVSYPIYHIENIVKPISKGPHAQQVIFLSADAFGVLPPVSILNPEQAQYYFLSGFTAKLAGTERGITEPTPTFSACFGAAFLSLHPTKYAEELVKKMEKTGAKAYLVNTGWNGTGKRISIRDTRGIIDAILDGSIDKAPTKVIPYFDFVVPTELPGVDPKILDPRDTYADAAQWDEKAKDLAGRFIKNFAKFTGNEAGKKLVAAGPKL